MTKHTFNTLVSATVALLVFVVSLPLTTQALFRSQPYYPNRARETTEDIMQKAKNDFTTRRDVRRDYHRALEIYRDMLNGERGGKDVDASKLVKPDVNDPETWEFYLDQEGEGTTHAAARADVDPIAFDKLSEREQQEMRRTVRLGYCSEGLRNYVAGFYELCRSLVGKKSTKAPRGILNDLARLKANRDVVPNTLSERLRLIREAYKLPSRENVRPGRPTRAAAPTE